VPEDKLGSEHGVDITPQTFVEELGVLASFLKQPSTAFKLNTILDHSEVAELTKAL